MRQGTYTFHRVLFAIQFVVAVLLLLIGCGMTLVMVGLTYEDMAVFPLLFSFLFSSVAAVLPAYILGTAVFGDLSRIPDVLWRYAAGICVVSFLSLLFWWFGPGGDAWDAYNVPAFGSVLIISFFHCWLVHWTLKRESQ